ncbi:hypothetical protein [Intestinimonas massiliensis (ex Afouda et al. 2020)]|uniref:hypothetical protein n=1 Tax=Intestinimonas massiliensis (ex Afouda et al. 2020) TaxID=1673721 RepID=UPI001F5FC7F4|nr:hypothetical protein [Intestinimonas massiliensis (ex Afouda et al. 2020)]
METEARGRSLLLSAGLLPAPLSPSPSCSGPHRPHGSDWGNRTDRPHRACRNRSTRPYRSHRSPGAYWSHRSRNAWPNRAHRGDWTYRAHRTSG